LTPPRTIIVSGLPRSGTSLLMAMLQAAGIPLFTDHLREADPSNPKGYFEYDAVKRLAPNSPWLAETSGHAVKIVAPLIRRLPPDFPCDVLLLERSLTEVLASQAAMLAHQGKAAADSRILRPAFEKELSLTRTALDGFPRCRWLPISHRLLLTGPTLICQEITSFLRLPLDPALMASTIDPSLYRQQGEKADFQN
jgi:hypothetical protein